MRHALADDDGDLPHERTSYRLGHERDGAAPSAAAALDLDREHRNGESVVRQLVEVGEQLDDAELALASEVVRHVEAVALPASELVAVHAVRRERVDADHAHAAVDEPPRGLHR